MKKYFVECAPTTPNGKLHLGHVAGPYIAADIFNRLQQVNKVPTFFACDMDMNQSYVRLAAIKAGLRVEDLLNKNVTSIKDTFANYDIGFDFFNRHNTNERTAFIVDFMNKLLKSKYVIEKDVEFYVDEISGKFLVEAFISGTCSKCSSLVKGGVCEMCGYYNFSTNMINPFSTIDQNAAITKKACKIHVLTITSLRIELMEKLNTINIDKNTRELIANILSDMANEFPITLPLEDGISLGSTGLKLNPWMELLGSTYYLKHKAQDALECTNLKEISQVSFIGIDNTFYYVIIHNLARICMGLEDFPESYFINKFYLLNNIKFSTSRNNAVWADEALQYFDANLLRLFLATTHPYTEPYSFSMKQLGDFKKKLEANNWLDKLHSLLKLNVENKIQLNYNGPKAIAQLLLDTLDETVSNKIFYLVQIICPSMFKKTMRQIGKVPHIIKETSNSFKRELGVELNRLILLDEHKFSSSIVIVEPGRQTAPHSHSTLDEIFYIIQGHGTLSLNNDDFTINTGDYMYIPAGMKHTIKPIGNSEVKFITIAWYI